MNAMRECEEETKHHGNSKRFVRERITNSLFVTKIKCWVKIYRFGNGLCAISLLAG